MQPALIDEWLEATRGEIASGATNPAEVIPRIGATLRELKRSRAPEAWAEVVTRCRAHTTTDGSPR